MSLVVLCLVCCLLSTPCCRCKAGEPSGGLGKYMYYRANPHNETYLGTVNPLFHCLYDIASYALLLCVNHTLAMSSGTTSTRFLTCAHGAQLGVTPFSCDTLWTLQHKVTILQHWSTTWRPSWWAQTTSTRHLQDHWWMTWCTRRWHTVAPSSSVTPRWPWSFNRYTGTLGSNMKSASMVVMQNWRSVTSHGWTLGGTQEILLNIFIRELHSSAKDHPPRKMHFGALAVKRSIRVAFNQVRFSFIATSSFSLGLRKTVGEIAPAFLG